MAESLTVNEIELGIKRLINFGTVDENKTSVPNTDTQKSKKNVTPSKQEEGNRDTDSGKVTPRKKKNKWSKLKLDDQAGQDQAPPCDIHTDQGYGEAHGGGFVKDQTGQKKKRNNRNKKKPGNQNKGDEMLGNNDGTQIDINESEWPTILENNNNSTPGNESSGYQQDKTVPGKRSAAENNFGADQGVVKGAQGSRIESNYVLEELKITTHNVDEKSESGKFDNGRKVVRQKNKKDPSDRSHEQQGRSRQEGAQKIIHDRHSESRNINNEKQNNKERHSNVEIYQHPHSKLRQDEESVRHERPGGNRSRNPRQDRIQQNEQNERGNFSSRRERAEMNSMDNKKAVQKFWDMPVKKKGKRKKNKQGNEEDVDERTAITENKVERNNSDRDKIKELERDMIFPLKKKSTRFIHAKFFCRLCEYHMDEVEDCLKHMKDSRHARRLEVKKIQKKLKKMPSPSAQQMKALDQIIKSIVKEHGLSEDDVQYRKRLTVDLEAFLQSHIPGVSLCLYGSSLTGIGLKGSDVNIDLVVPESLSAAKGLTQVFKLLKDSDKYEDVRSDFSAKIPSVYFTDLERKVFCQLTINSVLAYKTSQVLSIYTRIDPRVVELSVALRHWARICRVDRQEEGTLPAYCLALMTIYYLQQRKPPVLPVLMAYEKTPTPSSKKNQIVQVDFNQLNETADRWQTENTETVGSLWLGLLKFYSLDFDCSTHVICVRQHAKLTRAERKWNSKRVAVEDPFSNKRNAARCVTSFLVFEYIWDCLRKAYYYFGLPTNYESLSFEEKHYLKNFKANRDSEIKETTEGNKKLEVEDGDCVEENLQEDGEEEEEDNIVTSKTEDKSFEEILDDEDVNILDSDSDCNDDEVENNKNERREENVVAEKIIDEIDRVAEGDGNVSDAENFSDSTLERNLNMRAAMMDEILQLTDGQNKAYSDKTHGEIINSDKTHSDNTSSDKTYSGTINRDKTHNENTTSEKLHRDNTDSDKTHSDNIVSDQTHSDNTNSDKIDRENQISDIQAFAKEIVVNAITSALKSVSLATSSEAPECDRESCEMTCGNVDHGTHVSNRAGVNEKSNLGNMNIMASSLETKKDMLENSVKISAGENSQTENSKLQTVESVSFSERLKVQGKNLDFENSQQKGQLSEKQQDMSNDSQNIDKVDHTCEDTLKKQSVPTLKYDYCFSEDCLTDGKGPAIICCICDKEGHLKHNCPEENLPELEPLPPMKRQHLQLLTDLLKQVPRDFGPTELEYKERERTRYELEGFIQELYQDARLDLFGSSYNGFGFKQSDMDLCLTFDGVDNTEDMDVVAIIEELTKKLKTHKGLYNVFPITTAKVPIVKFKHRRSQLEGDISLYNLLALHNTRLVRLYSSLDNRVKVLGYALKVFAKVCDIGDASRGSLSSYAYILMALYYLQQCKPPVIPVLQELYAGPTKPQFMVEGWNTWYFEKVDKLREVWPDYGKNRMSIGELWVGLFKFYTEEFNFRDYTVCIRQLEPLTRFEKLWNGKCLAIEDPFDLNHNLGSGLSRKMNQFIIKAFIRGRYLYGTPIADTQIPQTYQSVADYFFDSQKLTEGTPPTDRCCRVCNKIGHIAKECPIVTNRKEREEREKKEREDKQMRQRRTEDFHRQEQIQRGRRTVSESSSNSIEEAQPFQRQYFYNSSHRSNSVPSTYNGQDRSLQYPPGSAGQRPVHISQEHYRQGNSLSNQNQSHQLTPPPLMSLPTPRCTLNISPTKQMRHNSNTGQVSSSSHQQFQQQQQQHKHPWIQQYMQNNPQQHQQQHQQQPSSLSQHEMVSQHAGSSPSQSNTGVSTNSFYIPVLNIPTSLSVSPTSSSMMSPASLLSQYGLVQPMVYQTSTSQQNVGHGSGRTQNRPVTREHSAPGYIGNKGGNLGITVPNEYYRGPKQ